MENYPTRGSERLANKAVKRYKDGDSPTEAECEDFDHSDWRPYAVERNKEMKKHLRSSGGVGLYPTLSQVQELRDEEQKIVKNDCDQRFIKSAQDQGKCGRSKRAGV